MARKTVQGVAGVMESLMMGQKIGTAYLSVVVNRRLRSPTWVCRDPHVYPHVPRIRTIGPVGRERCDFSREDQEVLESQ